MNFGHPVEYIQLNTRHVGEAIACKYCGLRYALAGHEPGDHPSNDAHDQSGHHGDQKPGEKKEIGGGDDGYDQRHQRKHHSEVVNKRFLP